MRLSYIAFFLFSTILFSASCRKDDFSDDPKATLEFSADTVHFDTVFVSVGSATKNFSVTNPLKKSLKIKNIRLAGGANSAYRINIDGRATTQFEDYEIAPGDSFFIFVEVTIDPNNLSLPFIVSDSILFETNGNPQKVILDAYGQNAHFFSNQIIDCNAVWTNDKPYVIYDSIAIQAGCKLTIEKGVKIYNHKNSGIFVLGTLEVNGTKDEPVIFSGDRLESKYQDEPGQWIGIRFVPKSTGNKIKHAIISNAIIGVEVDSLPVTGIYNLQIEKSIIRYCSGIGLLGITSSIEAKNLLIHSCEQFTFYGSFGGNYQFTNATLYNTETKTAKQTASFGLTNFYVDDNNKLYYTDLIAAFRNCIIWGKVEEELAIFKEGANAIFDTAFDHNIIKTKDYQFNSTNQRNISPKVKNARQHNYTLDSLSPAINAGIKFPGQFLVTDDLLENQRDDKPDLGCYEYK